MTRTRSPVRSGRAARTFQRSPSTSAQPSGPVHSITSPDAPIMRCAPLTTGRRRAFAAMPAMPMTNAAETSVSAPISVSGMPKPGASLSISSSAPKAKAATPPMPSAP